MNTLPRQLRSRRGAVLILVIVLLVLMALMGVAYMSSARIDRASASENVVNAQIELLLDGARNIAQGLVTADLVGQGGVYRRASPSTDNNPLYKHWDHPEGRSDPWLASRVPVRLADLADPHQNRPYLEGEVVEHSGRFYVCGADQSESTAPPPGSPWIDLVEHDGSWMTGARPVWPYISAIGESYVFNDVRHNVSRRRLMAFPTAVERSPGEWVEGIRMFPGEGTTLRNFIGADADGDGIADSLLFPMTLSEHDGVRYYAAIRIIDNNSAVNALTAFRSEGPNGRDHLFPSHINLQSLLGNLDAYAEALGGGAMPSLNPANRSDFAFDSIAEALWMQIGRRLDQSQYGRNTDATFYTTPSETESVLLAHRFVLENPDAVPSELAQFFPAAFPVRYVPFGGTTWDEWSAAVSEWFDFTRLRPLLVTSNPVSNAISPRSIINQPDQPVVSFSVHTGDVMARYDDFNVKTSINTADFGELWRAFWCVMVEGAANSDPQPGTERKMFRNMQRWPSIPGDGSQLPVNVRVLLRSSLAAVNAMDLRDSDDDITTRTFSLRGTDGVDRQFTVYGMEKQPFLTEVVLHRAADPITEGDYIGVELFNPHDEAIDLTGWKVAMVDRNLSEADPDDPEVRIFLPLRLTHLADLSGSLDAGGFLVLQNRTDPDVPVGSQVREIPSLHEVRGKELVLLRPRLSPGSSTDPAVNPNVDPRLSYDPQNLHEMVPVDQFDLTELYEESAQVQPPPRWYHYSRSTENWQWVFPGRYTPYAVDPDPVLDLAADLRYVDLQETEDLPSEMTLGAANAGATAEPRYVIQLNQPGWAGAQGRYPFGGFARNGDILKVPFIGAYKIGNSEVAADEFWELNSVVMDAAMADDFEAGAPQSVGRFAPRHDPAADPADDAYAWAADLFDYLTVMAPHDDYLPNANPRTYSPVPDPVANSAVGSANSQREKFVGVHGLINVNTAPWRVLATLPFVPGDSDSDGNGFGDDAERIARAIVADRHRNGAFRNLFDLLRVEAFRAPPGRPSNANGVWGDFEDDTVIDFEDHYLMLTRISNLVTTRSDSFTVYVLVQGWRGTGTASPELAAERRAAFTLDRTNVTQKDQSLILRNIPQN